MQEVKCAHVPCACCVDAGEQYCSHACQEDALQGDVNSMHGGCRCGHTECESR